MTQTITILDAFGTPQTLVVTPDGAGNYSFVGGVAYQASGGLLQPVTLSTPLPVFPTPSRVTYALPSGNCYIGTGGTSQQLFGANEITTGAWIQNSPSPNTYNLYVNIVGSAASTSAYQGTFVLVPGQTLILGPSTLAVNVNAAQSGVQFAAAKF